MKSGEQISFKGTRYVAVQWLQKADVCTGCALIETRPNCLTGTCHDKIMVTVPEYIAMKLTGEIE